MGKLLGMTYLTGGLMMDYNMAALFILGAIILAMLYAVQRYLDD